MLSLPFLLLPAGDERVPAAAEDRRRRPILFQDDTAFPAPGNGIIIIIIIILVSIVMIIIKIKIHSSFEIEDLVETHLCKLCVILRSRVLRVVCPH